MASNKLRLLWLNLATDTDDVLLGFTSSWIRSVAKRVEYINVITMRAGRVQLPGNVRVYSLGKEKGYGRARRATEFYKALFHILGTQRVDRCFSHMAPLFTVMAAPFLRTRGIAITTWFAHPSLTMRLRLAHWLSTNVTTSFASAYPYRKDKLVVIGQGIDTNAFSPGDKRDADPLMIVCPGRLSPVKDQLTLVRAVSVIRNHVRDPFVVVLLGGPATARDAQYVRLIQSEIARLRLEKVVRIEKPVTLAEMPSWYRRSTLCVNLTMTGSGDKVALEAMSSGLPCLVANEGFRQTLGDHAESLTFTSGDVNHLAKKLSALMVLASSEREQLGLYLRDRIVRMHSLEGLADKLVEVLRGRRHFGTDDRN
jgi:glycosyltransferase involved in cell wall biosynthesis